MVSRRDLHDVQLNIRVRNREMITWKKAAKHADEPLAVWIRKILNLAAVPAPPPVAPVISGDQIELPFEERKKA